MYQCILGSFIFSESWKMKSEKLCSIFIFLEIEKWKLKIDVYNFHFSEHRKMKKECLCSIFIFFFQKMEKWKIKIHVQFSFFKWKIKICVQFSFLMKTISNPISCSHKQMSHRIIWNNFLVNEMFATFDSWGGLNVPFSRWRIAWLFVIFGI